MSISNTNLLSVVIPVYNESENIRETLYGIGQALRECPHEILIVYDFDEDTTLPAIRAMPDCPDSVRPVKNDIARGVVNALKKGIAEARGDVVVTTMADLSDDPADIPEMVRKCREGAAVVAGSRYMKGGKQVGGPMLKRFLSRMAGLSLYGVAGLNTHDATSNFRAYRRDFLDSVSIESVCGFEVALELTVKAHNAGKRVEEVPTTWRDRTAGESRFQLRKWLPEYLRWYFSAMTVPIAILLAVFLLYYMSVDWIRYYTFPVPVMDNKENISCLVGDEPVTLTWLWSLHNEHRLLFPRLWYLLLASSVGGNETLVCLGNSVWMLCATIVCLYSIRRIRGRFLCGDLIVPLLLLSPVLCHDNWKFSFNGCNLIPTALLIVAGSLLISRPDRISLGRSILLLGCIALLPLCGIAHVVTGLGVSVAASWIAFRCWKNRPSFSSRSASFLLFLSVIYVLCILFLYLNGYQGTDRPGAGRIDLFLPSSFSLFFSALLGAFYRIDAVFFIAMIVMSGLLFSVSYTLGRRIFFSTSERFDAAVLLAVLAVSALLIACVSWGRTEELMLHRPPSRLVSFALPAVVFLYLIQSRYFSLFYQRFWGGALLFVLGCGLSMSHARLSQDDATTARYLAYRDLWRFGLAETLYDKSLYDALLLPPEKMEQVIRHRLGALRKIKSLRYFEDLEPIKRYEPPTESVMQVFNLNPEEMSADGDRRVLRVRIERSSVTFVFPDISVKAEHIAVAKMVLEHESTGRILPLYFYRGEGYRDYYFRNGLSEAVSRERKTDFVIQVARDVEILRDPVGKPRLDDKGLAKKNDYFQDRFSYDFFMPLPGDYLIHSVEFRSLPYSPSLRD